MPPVEEDRARGTIAGRSALTGLPAGKSAAVTSSHVTVLRLHPAGPMPQKSLDTRGAGGLDSIPMESNGQEPPEEVAGWAEVCDR